MRNFKICNFFSFILIAVLLSSFQTNITHAGEKFKDKPYFKDKPFFKEVEKSRKKGLFNLNLDIQLGLGISNTSFDLNKYDSTTAYVSDPGTKLGPNIGAILSVDFFGYGFTSGVQYSSKGFETATNKTTALNYFNIPLLFYFDFQLDKVIIDGNVGPYFGLLLSQNDDSSVVPFKVKNFDLGLTGNIQGAYMFQKHLGALLGVKYEYGGLNNLGKNEAINSIKTSTFFIYSGIKFVL
jgi:hypothetical protein